MMSEHQKINDAIARLIGAQAIELICAQHKIEELQRTIAEREDEAAALVEKARNAMGIKAETA